VAAVVCGRAAAFALTWILASSFRLPPGMTSAAVVLGGLPGVALELAVVPLALRALSKRDSLLFRHEQ
jgi:hypothetical protein